TFGDPKWTEYVFSFEVKRESGDNGFSALFRSPSDGKAYLFTLGCNHNSARRLELAGGRGSAEAVAPEVADDECLKENIWHKVEVDIRGAEVKCRLDGLTKFECDGLALDHGRVGLRVDGLTARFRNFLV